MKYLLFTIAISTLCQYPLFGKEKLPAMILGLKNDTLHGEIKVKNNFDNGRNRAFAYLQFSIEFTQKEGQTKEFKPGQITGFLVWTSDTTFEKYVSARLGYTASVNEEEASFRRPGMAARFDVSENEAFVRVLEDTGEAKLYAFYEEDVLVSNQGGMPPTMYNSLNDRFLVRKGDGPFIKLNSKSKRKKVQLLELYGDCAKIKAILDKPKLDTGNDQILRAIVTGYNKNCLK